MELTEHLFRRESGRMVAVLPRIFGFHNIALVEDVVQDAFCRATEVWAYRGVPENPSAWLYPLSGIPMFETRNGLFEAETLFSRWGREVREKILNEPTPSGKVDLIQQELVALMPGHQRRNPLVEFCVNALRTAPGRVSIRQLEKITGYSRRYLDILFQRHVGLSPKVLAEIFRFQRLYGKLAELQSFEDLKDEVFDDYYDQAHFVKEFKRMTGYAPGKFLREVPNQLGRLHSVGGSNRFRIPTISNPPGLPQ